MSKPRTRRQSAKAAGPDSPDATKATSDDLTSVEARTAGQLPPTEDEIARIRKLQDELFAARNVDYPKGKAPKEPDTTSFTPNYGPNEDGLSHQTRLAHAATDDGRAAVLADIDSNRRA